MALLGMPNTGKSTLFNRLSGGQAQVANWPGLTMELLRGAMPQGRHGQRYTLVDLPGIHDLSGSSEDEAIVQRFMRHTPPDLILLVLNASQLTSQLRLALQIRQLRIPMVVVLNMSDEAHRFGIKVDHLRLATDLGLPVRAISAKRNEGIHDLIETIHQVGQQQSNPEAEAADIDLDAELERLVAASVQLPERFGNRRTRLADRLLLNPLVGVVLFLGIVLAMFQLLYVLGAPLQDTLGSLFDWIQTTLLQPGLAAIGAPEFLAAFLSMGYGWG